jgi:radical SAM family protein
LKDLLLITPPFTQLNTPYPATAYLKGFLNTKQISSFQMDLGIEVILSTFSGIGLKNMFDHAFQNNKIKSSNAQRIFAIREDYILVINDVIAFLQGANPSLAKQVCTENFLPQASRYEQLDEIEWAFGSMGFQDKAKHLCTLFLEDLSDFINECVDENFGFSRYAERLGRSANNFDELYDHLQKDKTYIDNITLKVLEKKIEEIQPKLVCLSVPFPGNLYSAFRSAQFIKRNYPQIKIAMGGGFPNTELRSIKDTRVFEFFDFITLDDGELPIEILAANVLKSNLNNSDFNLFKRTFLLEKGEIVFNNYSLRKDYKQADVGTPDYTDLLLDKYISVIEIANPMHSLWSDGRWNKLTMAHGCYWGKCTFCDVSLDYIKIYEPIAAKLLVDRMEELVTQTGEKGFHFVDEAAPPALMRAVAIEIIRRKLILTWWTNIRFEKSFTADLCRLLKASGCIAVSGGLEVASDRLLALIQKGVTVEQVAKVTSNFTEAGIMVHSYLMYAYPTQTIQETIDSLEMVRQMFSLGIIQSGFWHQFALTAHSPIGLNPDDYGITPIYKEISFANNDIEFSDSTGIDHNKFSFGLKKSLLNYMHGLCFDFQLQEWFDFKIPNTSIKEDFILNSLESSEEHFEIKSSSKLIWIGTSPSLLEIIKNRKGKQIHFLNMIFYTKVGSVELTIEKEIGEWLSKILTRMSIYSEESFTHSKFKAEYENHFDDFELFWYSETVEILRDCGLLVL